MGQSFSLNTGDNRRNNNPSSSQNPASSPDNGPLQTETNQPNTPVQTHGPIRAVRNGNNSFRAIRDLLTRTNRRSSPRIQTAIQRLITSNNNLELGDYEFWNNLFRQTTSFTDSGPRDFFVQINNTQLGSSMESFRILGNEQDQNNIQQTQDETGSNQLEVLRSGTRLSRRQPRNLARSLASSAQHPQTTDINNEVPNGLDLIDPTLITAAIEAIRRTVANFRNSSEHNATTGPVPIDSITNQEQFTEELSNNITRNEDARFATMPISYLHNEVSYRFFRTITNDTSRSNSVPVLILGVRSAQELDFEDIGVNYEGLDRGNATPLSSSTTNQANNPTEHNPTSHTQNNSENTDNTPRRRSWIVHMYVTLINSENPIFSASNYDGYEELLRLSGIIGQVKPPVTTLEEINTYVPVIAYSKKDKRVLNMKNNESCPVCLLEFKKLNKLRILKCLHGFHKECIDVWLTKGNNNCPVCRSIPFGSNEKSTSDINQ